MSKSLKYVKDFDFSSAGKTVGLCKGGMAKKGYAKGGAVVEKATGESYPSRRAMVKHESMETPRMQKEELVQRASVKAPAAPPGMLRDRASLGIKDNKNPGIARRRMPVAPAQPMIPLKAGGAVPKAGAAKVGKVMGEFKSGELHSGSKSGPVVKNRKQALAIALSEARAAGKK